jgi:hypothetical protein
MPRDVQSSSMNQYVCRNSCPKLTYAEMDCGLIWTSELRSDLRSEVCAVKPQQLNF